MSDGTDMLKEGTKYDNNKVQLDLIPPELDIAVGEILTLGAKKYEPYNWAKGIKYSRVIAALLRHLQAYRLGEKFDPETNKSHLWHAATNLAFLIYFDEHPDKYSSFNNLPPYSQQEGNNG